MIASSKTLRAMGALGAVVLVAAGLTACSSSSASSSTKGVYTFWDPYPQFDQTSAWTKLVDSCGTAAGVTVKRTGYDTSDLTNKALLAGQQNSSPDILLVDNPVVSTLVDAGLLTSTKATGIDTSTIDANLMGAGQVKGTSYGIPIGANTLALYYNKAVLKAAGVDIAAVTNWTSLTAALEKVVAAGKKGITFAGIGTEEGSFQFLPWYWGSGANLNKLDSPQAVSALALWTNWVKKGLAPNSVINNTQTTTWQEFMTGDYAFGENGTWQLAAIKKSGMDYGILSIPAMAGGAATAPTGGEFLTIPVQSDTTRYATSAKIIKCLASTDNLVKTDTTLSYIAPTKAAQEKQLAANPALAPWIEAVHQAKGRTSDNLGTKYPLISQQMWSAVQKALSGASSPQAALTTAQAAAVAAIAANNG
jgi:multiple sugar transport system substrate-binding protein